MTEVNKVSGRPMEGQRGSLEEILRVQVNRLIRLTQNRLLGNPGVGNGGTAGNARTTANFSYTINGQVYDEVAADDFWDLSGETDLTAGQYQAVILCIDNAGAASYIMCDVKTTAALAMAEVPKNIPADKCIVGIFVSDPSMDWDSGGLATTGTFYDGLAEGAMLGQVHRHV